MLMGSSHVACFFHGICRNGLPPEAPLFPLNLSKRGLVSMKIKKEELSDQHVLLTEAFFLGKQDK